MAGIAETNDPKALSKGKITVQPILGMSWIRMMLKSRHWWEESGQSNAKDGKRLILNNFRAHLPS